MFISGITWIIVLASLGGSFFITSSNSTYSTVVKPVKQEVKAIYLTAYTAGQKTRREELASLVDNSELNSLVIDIKDATGRIFFPTSIALAKKIGSEQILIPDLKDWLVKLKQRGIYTVARIVVFQDPYLANKMPDIALKSKSGSIWHDYKGQSWVDPTQKSVWDYNLDLAKEAVKIGFNEINFDYIRFPSDGNIKQIVYANLDNNNEKQQKNIVMKEFYEYVNSTLKFEPVITSADLFGMTLWRSDGMNIGQRLEDAAPNFDFISPMVYPSHYPAGFEGFANPADHPYEIVYRSLKKGEAAMAAANHAQLRPWLQDFDLGAVYTADMIRQQKQASSDSKANGWLVWNASNRYTIDGFDSE